MTQADDVVKLAVNLACEVYTERARELVEIQTGKMKHGVTPQPIDLYPPTPGQVNIMAASLMLARDAGIHAALGVVNNACDAPGKPTKATLQTLAKTIRSLKSSSLSLAG